MEPLSRRTDRIEPSATLSISARADELTADGVDVVNFGAGEPDFPTPDPIKQAGIDAIENDFTGYTAASGHPDLKAAIRDRYRRERNLDYDLDEITVGCGAKHVLFNLMAALLDPGDEVIVFAPYWVSYPTQIRFFDGKPVVVKTQDTGFVPELDRVRDAVSEDTCAILLNSPANPTGALYPDGVIEELVDLCRQNDLWLISDEIYEHITYGENGFVSPLDVVPGARDVTVLVNGVSKTYSMTGWRIGYGVGPKSIIERINRLMGHSTSNPCSISQKAAIRALELDDDSVTRMVEAFRERRDLICRRLDALPGVDCRTPGGAFYAFPDVTGLLRETPGSDSDHELTMTLLDDAHIACVPGSAFGAPGHLRLSYANSRERIAEGMDRLEGWVKEE